MQIILIGNYLPDRQESMIRFANLLNTEFQKEGVSSTIWWPTVFFGRNAATTTSGIGKWLAYIDKYIIFPLILKRKILRGNLRKNNCRFHICDHSNAPYLKYLPVSKTVITCHDVIAIRTGLGFTDSHQALSALGKLQQKWILSYLRKAERLATVSQFTLDQLKELTGTLTAEQRHWKVIHNSLNAAFKQINPEIASALVVKAGISPGIPFLLHVGSGLPRKNRKLLIDMAHVLTGWDGYICYAGEAVEEDLQSHACILGVKNIILSIPQPDHDTLVALYNQCDAFVFPSLSEGFGWPLIEAQACGAPVITSNMPPMPEISGGAALYADPTNATDFAVAYRSLQNTHFRSELIERGFKNSEHFTPKKMIDEYIQLHSVE